MVCAESIIMQVQGLKQLSKITLTLSLMLALFPTWVAYSTSFSVNDAGDLGDISPGDGICETIHGTCTLRAAIDETNTLSGPNTITIPAMNIVMNDELRIQDHVGDDSVHIQGAGTDLTIIDGNNSTRAFYFAVFSGTHSISDLTIRNANNQYPSSNMAERNGGGIFNEAKLTLTNVRVTNSTAFQGGGVYSQHAFGPTSVPSLTLNNVTLSHNNATADQLGFGGGGLFNGSALSGTDVTITDNTSPNQGGGYYNNSFYTSQLINFSVQNNVSKYGAGINNDLGEMILENGTISSNTSNCCGPGGASPGGAGLYNNEGTIFIRNVTISNNHAIFPGGYGGGIYNGTYMELYNVAIIDNQTTYGAGIFNGNYDGSENQLSITNVTISNNVGVSFPSGDAEGGGIYNTNNGKIMIQYSTITQNSARLAGGITNRDTNTIVKINNSILASNADEWGLPDCRGVIDSLGHNIIGNPHGTPTLPCNFASLDTDLLETDPMLGDLEQSNIGYHPLLPNSPAINRGADTYCPESDIIGTNRPIGEFCDIGSFENSMPLSDSSFQIFLPIITRKD